MSAPSPAAPASSASSASPAPPSPLQQQPITTTKAADLVARPSSEGRPTEARDAGDDQLRLRVHSAVTTATATMAPAVTPAAEAAAAAAAAGQGRAGASERDGEQPPAASSPPKHTTLDIEALIALATSHSPPPGYVHPQRSGTPSFMYSQGGGGGGYSHSGSGTPNGGGGDSRVALFVGNLPFRVRWQDLKDLMRRAGTVLRADVALGPDNRSKGHGMVLMGSREDGMRAIEMFHGYNWQTRILEVRPERLPPEYEQHAAPMQQGLPRQGSSPAGFHHQPPPQGGHVVASMFLNHSHMGQMDGLLANGGFRSTSPYNGGGLGVGGGGGGRSPHNSSGASPGLQHASPAATAGMLNAAGLGPLSASSPAFASPSLSAALLNHNQQQIVRSLTPKARSATPASSSSALGPSASEISALEQALATNLRLTAQSQSLAGTAPGARAPPPGSLGSLSPLPAFGQVGHALQPAYAQGRQQDSRTASRGPDNLAGRVLFVGNLPFHVQWQDLKDLFRTAGNIQRANVALGADGRSRGFGSVQYSTREDAEVAVGLFDGYELHGRKLQVHPESAEGSRSYPPPPQPQPQGPYHQPPMPNQHQQQQARFQQRAQQQQQLGQLQMNFGRLPPFGGQEAAYYVPSSPFHGPPSPFHVPQSPSAYGPPSPYAYFPPAFPGPQSFGAAFPGAQAAASNGLPSTAEEQGERESGGATKAADPAPSPIGPPRGHAPGRITLPPAYPFNNGPSSAGSAMSPMHGRGLPMLTPSMPSFQFHNGFPQTPPLFPQFLSPGLGPMSPPLHSPPFFHPYLNAAPGAPMFHPQDNPMFPPSAIYHQQQQQQHAPPLDQQVTNGEADDDGAPAAPLGAPVFASLSRDGSVSAGIVADDDGGEHSGDEGDEGDEPAKTPTLASAALPSTAATATAETITEQEGVRAE